MPEAVPLRRIGDHLIVVEETGPAQRVRNTYVVAAHATHPIDGSAYEVLHLIKTETLLLQNQPSETKG